jgi:uncharacterized protein YyaL (SSP411 family)
MKPTAHAVLAFLFLWNFGLGRSATAQPTDLPSAMAQASAQNRPILIFLSARWSGEVAAMRAETLSDSAVRAALTSSVVFLEIDRDEQPEIDAGLQASYAAINGRPGGYPLTVFCTPEGIPFEALGYVPPRSTGGGLGLTEIIGQVAELWSQDRARVEQHAAVIRDRVLLPASDGSAGSLTLDRDTALGIARSTAARMTTGGLVQVSDGAVPLPAAAIMLAAAGQVFDDKPLADASDRMLNGTVRGALRDHIQGGYFRGVLPGSSPVRVNPEKLLSVQAAWLRAFSAGHTQSKRSRYVEGVQEILRFTRSQMDIEGGGWKAFLPGMTQLPANQNPWLWSGDDIRGVSGIAEKDADVVVRYLGLVDRERRVPVPVSLLEPVAKSLGMSYDAANSALGRTRLAAASARQSESGYPRASQLRILQWEGAMITAYMLAAQVTGDNALRDHALASARQIVARDVKPDGTIPRMVLDGQVVVEGTYADYASVSEGLLNAYSLSEDKALLEAARRILVRGESLRDDNGTTGSIPALVAGGRRLLNSQDGELPSPLSVGAAAWMVLDVVEPGQGYRDKALQRIREVLGSNRASGVRPAESGAGWTLIALLSSAPGQ